MVILGIEVIVPGSEVQKQIGNPTQYEAGAPSKPEAVKTERITPPSSSSLTSGVHLLHFLEISIFSKYII